MSMPSIPARGLAPFRSATVTDHYTVPDGMSLVMVDATSGPKNITLPTPRPGSAPITVKRVGTGTNLVSLIGTVDTVVGGLSLSLANESVMLQAVAGGYVAISKS